MSGLPSELRDALEVPAPAGDVFALSDVHRKAKALRVPVFAHGTSARERIAELEEYLLLAAFYVGALHEERTDAHVDLASIDEEWEALHAYGKTAAEREGWRRQREPDLAARRHRLRWRVDRLSDEIARLDREHDKVSRAYTLIAGT
jgi:hypothetical protein